MDKLGLKCDPMTTADHQDAFRGFSTFLYVLVWGLVVVLYFNQNHLSYQSGCKRDKREPSYLLMSQILWRSVKYKTMPYLLFFDFVKIFFIEYGIVISQYPWEIASRTSPWIPKSTNAQVFHRKWHSTVFPHYLRVLHLWMRKADHAYTLLYSINQAYSEIMIWVIRFFNGLSCQI